jgi:hypothetical protein
MLMAAPMFATQPIPNPTFDIEFGKVLAHRSYTSAELLSALSKYLNPFSMTITATASNISLSADGKGLKGVTTVVGGNYNLKFNFKNKVNAMIYLDAYINFTNNGNVGMGLSEYPNTNMLSFYIWTQHHIRSFETVGGVSTTLYNRNIAGGSEMQPVKLYAEMMTKRIKFWATTPFPKQNTNGWQYATTTLSVPTQKVCIASLSPSSSLVGGYLYLRRFQVKFVDGVFT